MTFMTNKNGVPTAHTATNQGAVKTRQSTKQFIKCWCLYWETYAQIEQDGRAVPMDWKKTYFSLRPSPSEISQLRKMAHARGYKLVSINPIQPHPADEF